MNDLDPTVCPASTGLVGRDRDLAYIRSFFNNSEVQGAALLLLGEAGVGKTAVLDAVAAGATRNGVRVLRAAGVQFEADISYAGLNQLLLPLFDDFDVLDPVHRDALRVAVGIGGGPAPDRLLTSTAVLLLLRLTAARTPLLLVVDDLPWLDRATNAVLGFVARRLVGSQIGFLAASREGADSFFESSGLSEHRLEPLDDASSTELLALAYPDVSPAVRRRIAAEARGNPLALVELPAALSAEQRATLAALPAVLPLSERLQALFASRVAELPERSREMLLLAALDGTGGLAAVEAAAAGRAGIDDLVPAERNRLVTISADNRRLSFRHPLIGSAVVELASTNERRRAHQALANVLGDQPERRAWHLGEAATGPDETVAALLEEAARRRLRRGDALGAVAALTRAAGLSPAASDESRRLAVAAYVGVDSGGELEDATRLLAESRLVHPAGQRSLHAATASAFLLINRDGDIDTAYRLLVGAIESAEPDHGFDAEDEGLIEALHLLLLLCWYGGDPKLWEPMFAFMGRLVPEPPELLWVITQTFGDPARTGAAVLPQLTELIATVGDDPTRVIRVGTASVFSDRLGDFRWATRRLVEQGRAGAAPVRRHLGALMHLGLDYFHLGRWEDAAQLAAEGLSLCENHDYRFFAWYFHYIRAAVAAAQGDAETSAALTEEIVRWAMPRGTYGARFFACHARALAALGSGDFETAYQYAATLSPAGTLAPYVQIAMWGAMDLVEAAIRTGREKEAAAHAAAMRESSMAALSPRLEMLVLACEALTTPGRPSLDLFERALSLPEPDRWPFDVARVRLFYGERLRRLRATSESREQLAAALEAFQRLGAKPWVARTAAELRASGQSAPTAARPGPVALTAQELQIARLAATGLTNKQIAERLLLSHRTIGTHLYQIYPKLGITSRAALRDALSQLDATDGDG
ncbi:ATP-binding protein [Streptomyces justiciae]|uniref:ATP-binding protein n=1 Tax=Streptomyces justiciae TaxID=2780140 RepID=UPI001881E32A|nr:AAA family ATPase [Streptomyces justiciae]MBE8478459.1 AAA family ATPase [Streptomyces justiciae]MCW8384630.1 AAA family ATPase [Streptomyces justiciae]